MPKKRTIQKAQVAKREGKAPSTQAGEFVREEMEKLEEGDPRIKSRKQAIAIGLSEARRAGVELPPPKQGKTKTRKQAERDLQKSKKKKAG